MLKKTAQVIDDAPPAEIIVSDEQAAGTSAVSVAVHKSSESLSQPSGDNESQASRSPNSMPLPSAPRRAALPRKKPAKSPTPPTADMEVPLTEAPDILSSSDSPAITKKAEAGSVEQEIDKVTGEPGGPSDHSEAADVHAEIPEKDSALNDGENHDVEHRKSVHAAPPSHAPDVPDDAEDDDKEGDINAVTEVPVEHESHPARLDQHVDEPIEQPVDEPEDEAARRIRVAEKLAKMGGVNPLAPPVQRKPSVDETQTAHAVPPPAKRASLSRQSTDSLERRQSWRASSVGSTTAPEEGITAQRKLSVDETQTSPPVSPLTKRASLSRQSTDSLQRRQSLKRSSVDSTTVLEASPQEFPSRPSAQSRKSSVDPTVSGSVYDSVSRRGSQDVAGHAGQGVATTRIPEESEPGNAVEGVRGKHETYTEEPKSKARGKVEVRTRQKSDAADESLEVIDPDEEHGTSAPLVIPTPPAPKWTTRPQAVSVDPALAVEPVPIPPRTLEQVPPAVAPPPRRSIPPPPPSLLPEHDDEDVNTDQEDVEETPVSHQSLYQQASEDEGSTAPRRIPPRLASNDDNTDNESPLPVPTRRPPQPQGGRSSASSSTSSSRPARRSIPPPPPPLSAPVSDIEQDSDLDEILPTPLRRRSTTPGMPPSNEVPLIVPPPPHAEDPLRRAAEPSPLRHSYPPAIHASSDSRSPTPEDQSLSYLATTSTSDQEVLDEEEGDPIDPAFHSPSRSGSTPNLAVAAPAEHAQVAEAATTEQHSEQATEVERVKRTTIAERMAKLGGIQFGAAPIPPSFSRPPPPPRPDDESVVHNSDAPAPAPEEQTEIDEEEERARKERIAAKLAGMGGMRIGMMPLGPGALRPQQSHALREDNAIPLPTTTHARAVPPGRPPPTQSDSDLEHEGMSASHHSTSTSEEGVKVEAEESEMEEVSYEDANEGAPPPPVPPRSSRRTTSETESVKAASRPPVPTSVLTRRSSVQTTASGRTSSPDSSFSPRRSATMKYRSDYVMVEEPKGFVSDEVPSSSPSVKLVNRAPSTREPPSRRPPATDISSQWELPSIPTSSLEFGGSNDLSLSWSDAIVPESTVTAPPPPAPEKSSFRRVSQIVSVDQPRTSDELIAIWGRVGVQICEVATSLFEKSKKTLVGDGTYHGFVSAVVSEVPNAALPAPLSYGYVVYVQSGSAVQKRVSDIMPGDIVELQDAKFKGHKGIQTYNQHVGVGEPLVGIVSEFEPKKSKIRLFQANQHVGQQTVEAVSYRLEDLKSGTVQAFRVLDA